MSPHSAVVVVVEKVGGATMRVSGVGSSTVETSDILHIQAAAEIAPLAPIWAVKSKVKLSRAGAGMMGPKVEAILCRSPGGRTAADDARRGAAAGYPAAIGRDGGAGGDRGRDSAIPTGRGNRSLARGGHRVDGDRDHHTAAMNRARHKRLVKRLA